MPKKISKIRETAEKRWQRLGAVISRKFIASKMSNAKWVKLLTAITVVAKYVPCMNYKLVYEDEIFSSYTEEAEEVIEEEWFREPILYKELEWIEFPTYCNRGNTIQDLKMVEKVINKAGIFPVEYTSTGLRINGYVMA